jgi:hypothetical protein
VKYSVKGRLNMFSCEKLTKNGTINKINKHLMSLKINNDKNDILELLNSQHQKNTCFKKKRSKHEKILEKNQFLHKY